jgi:hypothetical protein
MLAGGRVLESLVPDALVFAGFLRRTVREPLCERRAGDMADPP